MTIAAMTAARVATAPAPSVVVVVAVDGRSAVVAADVVPVVRAVALALAADREVPAASVALAPELPVPGLRLMQAPAVVVLA